MSAEHREVMHRKYRMLLQFLEDLRPYAALDRAARRNEHYAIERSRRVPLQYQSRCKPS